MKARVRGWLVVWRKPLSASVKLNTDGSLLQDGRGGSGGVLQDEGGRVIFAFSESYNNVSVLYAEFHAMLIGVEMCWSRGLSSVQVESDSMILVQILLGKVGVPFKVRPLHQRLQRFWGCIGSVQHSFRQGNLVADALVARGVLGQLGVYETFQALPRDIRGLCAMDRMQIPSFRFKRFPL